MVSVPFFLRKRRHVLCCRQAKCVILAITLLTVFSGSSVAHAQTLRSATKDEIRTIRQTWGDAERAAPKVDGFYCTKFHFRTIYEVAVSVSKEQTVCSILSYSKKSDNYRELNYYNFNNILVPVSVFGNLHNRRTKAVIFLTGGPRGNKLGPNKMIDHLVDRGYTVFSPIYQGQVETHHPLEDISEAIAQVRELRTILDERLVAVVGASAGGYLAEAACDEECKVPLILVGPLMRSPESQLRDDWGEMADSGAEVECLRSSEIGDKVCDSPINLAKSFWGPWGRRSLATVIERQKTEQQTAVIISKDDDVVYSQSEINRLDKMNVTIRIVEDLSHENMLKSSLVWKIVDNLLSDKLASESR